jgi:hypothetical protein
MILLKLIQFFKFINAYSYFSLDKSPCFAGDYPLHHEKSLGKGDFNILKVIHEFDQEKMKDVIKIEVSAKYDFRGFVLMAKSFGRPVVRDFLFL